ncbi:MAG TPA: hypothetical protein PLF23_18685 [Candidatus Obscuribacter sp.]|nr:hypothetical protein [Candidatus Obscuribacter sp.]HNH75819.1 hypothetical protein [Candidatus Obscuribacter sp.]
MSEEALAATIQIGDLLVRSGLMSSEKLDEANRLAFKMRLPIGRILTMHGHVTEAMLAKAIEIQARIKDKALPLDHGVNALKVACRDDIEVDEALNRLMPKAKPTVVPTSNRLGEILMAAGYASPKQVEEAMIHAADTGLPLGMVLLSKGVLTRTGLNSALTAQRLIRQGVSERDKILFALKEARLRARSLTESLRNQAIDPSPIEQEFGIGELLVLAGIVSESQLMSARELEVVDGKSLEKAICESGFASEPCVQTAAQLLKMIKEGMLFENQAAAIVKKIQFVTSYDELNKVLAGIDEIQDELAEEKPEIQIPEILKKAGLISDKELQIATALALANRQPLLKTLLDAKLVNEKNLDLANQCKIFLDHNLIQLEQATIAIVYAIENNLTIDETLDCFGWSAPVV